MKKIFDTFLNKSGKEKITIVILIGILLLVIMIPVEKKDEDKASGNAGADTVNNSEITNNTFSYETYIENKLEGALSKVEGVGEVKTVVTVKSSGEKILAKDSEYSVDSLTETDNQNNKKVQKSEGGSDTHILIDGNSGSQPYITLQNMPEVEGVIVIAKGGGDGNVATEITLAVEALLGIPAHKIKVLRMS